MAQLFEKQFVEINTPVSGQAAWWVAAGTNATDNTIAPGVISLNTNPRFRRRRVYAYAFAGTASDSLAYLETYIRAYDDQGQMLFELPLNYYYKASTNAGAIVKTKIGALRPYSGIVPGGLDLNVQKPITGSVGGASDTETTPTSIYPIPYIDFRCTRIDLDVVKTDNFSPTKVRLILGTIAWDDAKGALGPGILPMVNQLG